jgi:membrane protein
MQTSFTLWGHLIKKTGQAWLDNNAARLGAALAFYSVLSLSPLLVLILAMASHLWGDTAAQGRIAEQMNNLVGQQGADAIQSILTAASTNKTGGFLAGIVGLVSLLFSASAMFGELQAAFNIIWCVPPPTDTGIMAKVYKKLFSFLMVIGSGFILILSVVVSAALAATSHFLDGDVPLILIAVKAINFIVSFAIVAIVFALIFKTVPDLIIPWRGVWPGAVLTTVFFIVGKGLIGLYLGHAGIGSSYGAAGSLIIVLVWIYYSAQILFFGAEFTYIYSCHFKLLPKEMRSSS